MKLKRNENGLVITRTLKIKRKLLLPVILICLLAGSVLGFLSYLSLSTTTINLAKSGSLTSNNPAVLNATGGSIYWYDWTITNQANQPTNYKIRLTLNESTLTTNEAKLRIFNTTALLSSNNTASNNAIITLTPNILVNSTIQGNFSIEFNNSADNTTYNLKVELLPGSFGFK